ncbi:hypothetical protein [Luteolibacter sp. AS25]|uniref:hypothetical protein n=1 Tax=Luteolibacter sp. AS25 TaxID=3135776 RepID=UPI00398B933D
MSPNTPILCGTLLAAFMAAGISHFWSVEQFIATYPATLDMKLVPVSEPVELPQNSPMPSAPSFGKQLAMIPAETNESSTELEAAVLTMYGELKEIRKERDTLVNQLAETNRDIMKMQFQIDTHSESFRPLPTQERDPMFFEPDYNGGVLPPRASPVYLPED